MRTSTIRPGLLVSLKTSVRGNVRFATRDIEPEHLTEDGEQLVVWETSKTVTDPVEFEKATKVRSRARQLIVGVCAKSTFGLLCPEAASDKLEDAILKARQLIDVFNAEAAVTRVAIFAIVGRVAADDVEAVKAIGSEVRDLIGAMTAGAAALDPQAIRAAADQARALGRMLAPEAQSRIKDAIDTARAVARGIVKAGETAAVEVDQAAIAKLNQARTSFLDLDPVADLATPAPSARAVDLEPSKKPARKKKSPEKEAA